MDANYLVVLVTIADAEAGVALGRMLVEEALAACVQVLPGGTAIYRWQGQLNTDAQAQLIIKTRRAVWPRLRERIVELHDDEAPEILALPVVDGLPAYLRWLDEATTPRWLIAQPQTAVNWRPYFEVYPRGRHTVAGDVRIVQGFESPQLDNRRDILVYLPPSYQGSIRRYPVIYMHDGQNLFDAATSYAGEWYADETMEELADEGIEAIIVGIPNMGERRFHEYMPFPEPNLQDAQGDVYVTFIADALKPVIDRDFRTLPDPASTGIAGSSLGGLISLYAMFRRPDVFGLAGVFSPALRWGRRGIFAFMQQAPFAQGKIYLDVGTAEGIGLAAGHSSQQTFAYQYMNQVRKMNALLLKKGYRAGENLLYLEAEGGIHHESAWARRLPDALRFLLRGADRR
jgi:predicted alpha/beta superfamily hydrolase/uncharacterized protein involved in tolerance to divalent cations